ncbi:MAG TPA: STAS domain-containing protein [Rhodocyclaceae bacterium]|nr:STAS domain-containing protein [Rhodocyclaceae bacterium]
MKKNTQQSAHEIARLALDANLTIYNVVELKRRLLDAVRAAGGVELDLSQVAEMDTAGFQLLVLAKRESQRLGHTLRIVAHSPAVREVIEFFNMVAYFGDPVVIPAGEQA